ncbi:26041_t:CDS:2 [Dentiscutata erythropus]|uniref:26041_t:CDS:1 n=1 Tax=Dentiscutata erythropus TaxID=1348616 RepID=A0A9N9GAA3_9GLOM|nr:26041_t:CDS:2 [Dentiscutata erythropus]
MVMKQYFKSASVNPFEKYLESVEISSVTNYLSRRFNTIAKRKDICPVNFLGVDLVRVAMPASLLENLLGPKKMVEIHSESEETNFNNIRRRNISTRNSERFHEIETIKWDQNEDFNAYTKRFYELADVAGLDDEPEQRQVELFLQSLPPSIVNIIQTQIKNFQVFRQDFQPTLKQVVQIATNHVDELRNKSIHDDELRNKSIHDDEIRNKSIHDDEIRNKSNKSLSKSLWSLYEVSLIFSPYMLSGNPEDSVFRDFAKSTEDMVSQINSADLPGSNEIMKHTVDCKITANFIERDPAFKNSGPIIATKLRKFGESVMEAGNDLHVMYRKGSYVFETFKIEIQTMMDKLDVQEPNKSDFFKERIKKMILVVQDFSDKVKRAKDSIIDAENNRDGLEKELVSGIREAEKFVEASGYWRPDSVDLRKAQDGLAIVNNILVHLRSAAYRLDEIIKNLRRYENSLFDVNADLESIFIVTKRDFNYLLNSVEVLQRSHRKFMAKENN